MQMFNQTLKQLIYMYLEIRKKKIYDKYIFQLTMTAEVNYNFLSH